MAMMNEEEIRAEVEELGRLTEAQEDILYNIALKQARRRICCLRRLSTVKFISR